MVNTKYAYVTDRRDWKEIDSITSHGVEETCFRLEDVLQVNGPLREESGEKN